MSFFVISAKMNFDQSGIDAKINSVRSKAKAIEPNMKTNWLLKAIGFIDLTTLGADDTPAKVEALCAKVPKVSLSSQNLCKSLNNNEIEQLQAVNPLQLQSNSTVHTASICVYPLRLPDVMAVMAKLDKEHKVNRDTGW